MSPDRAAASRCVAARGLSPGRRPPEPGRTTSTTKVAALVRQRPGVAVVGGTDVSDFDLRRELDFSGGDWWPYLAEVGAAALVLGLLVSAADAT